MSIIEFEKWNVFYWRRHGLCWIVKIFVAFMKSLKTEWKEGKLRKWFKIPIITAALFIIYIEPSLPWEVQHWLLSWPIPVLYIWRTGRKIIKNRPVGQGTLHHWTRFNLRDWTSSAMWVSSQFGPPSLNLVSWVAVAQPVAPQQWGEQGGAAGRVGRRGTFP